MTIIGIDANANREVPLSMVERVTLILEVFDDPMTALSHEEITARTGLPRSTVYRILAQLVKVRWLQHTSCGYSIGMRALQLGAREGGHGSIRTTAASVLRDLHQQTGQVAHLAVLDGDHVHYLDKVGGELANVLPSRVGGRFPAHITAVGKALLAWVEPERLEAIAQRQLERQPRRSISELDSLHFQLGQVRNRNGLAYEREEAVPGIECMAASIYGPNGPVAAISLSGRVRTMQPERFAPLLLNATRRVSRKLAPELASPGLRASTS